MDHLMAAPRSVAKKAPAKKAAHPGAKTTAAEVAEMKATIETQQESIDTLAWLLSGLLWQVRMAQAKQLAQQIQPRIEAEIAARLAGGGIQG